MAKVIAHAASRSLTVERLQRAIAASRVVGICTNLAFHTAVLKDPEFQAGGVDTGFVARLLARSPLKTEAGVRG
jgi:acetyl/propionyl-CoA carboxylase alpha subunit